MWIYNKIITLLKAQQIKEAINFKRTGNSRKSMKIGQWSPQEIDRTLDEAVLKFAELGYSVHKEYRDSKYFNFMLAELMLENIISYSSLRDNLNGNFVVYYTDDPVGLKDYIGNNIDIEPIDENGNWILIDSQSTINYKVFRHPVRAYYNFENFDNLLKALIRLDFKESIEDWDWLEITKKRIAVIES